MKNPGTYLNSNFISGQITGTCCYGCAKRDDCPMEAVGRKCSKDHDTCPELRGGMSGAVCALKSIGHS